MDIYYFCIVSYNKLYLEEFEIKNWTENWTEF